MDQISAETADLFQIDTYIEPHEAFHFARKSLAKRFPARVHRHDYFEVLLVERGSTAHRINGAEEVLERGHLVCLRPDDAHAFRAHRHTGCQILNIMFRCETAAHLARRYPEETRGRFFWSTDPMPAKFHLSGPRFERAVNVAQELQTTRRSLARVEEFLLSLMNRIVVASDRLQDQAPRWLIHACASARSAEVFRAGAAGFIQVAGRSHEHVCRAMRQHLGTSPSAYVNTIRIEHAAQLLGGSDLSITDIAEDCGITNVSHFYRLFRQQYGTSPGHYRRHHLKNPVASSG